MDFQQIRDFVNPAVAQATGLQEVDNLQMPVPVAYVPVQIVIDGSLSLTSENPVQNKVIAVAIQNLDGRITAIEGQFSEGVTEAVNNWLDAHPEATTTVQDGAITYAKLDTNLKGEVDQISDLKSAFNWISNGKNLCGMKPKNYYPVYLEGGQELTFSTKDGANLGVSGCALEVYGEDKTTRLNYYTFPSDQSQRTIRLSDDYQVRYIHWNRTVGKELQVELGDTKTSYEEYWGNPKAFSEKGQNIKYLESIAIGKNLCGMDVTEYYPVNLSGICEFTMSTSDGSNVVLSGLYLLLFNENKEQVNYITFNTGVSEKTDYADFTNVKYIRWSRVYPVPLQVELGYTKTTYEQYWGDAKKFAIWKHNFSHFDNSLIETQNLIKDEHVLDLKYLNVSNGSVSTTDNPVYQAVEAYIPVEASTDYYFGVFDSSGSPKFEHSALTVCFYNANTDFISTGGGCYLSSGINGTNCNSENGMMKCTSPATAKYARVGSNTRLEGFRFFLCKKANFSYYVNNQAIKANHAGLRKRLVGKKLAIFGDSIMGRQREYWNIPSQIGFNTGMTVYNFGFGGCRMSVHEGNWDKCSMYRLADDIYNGSFTDLVSSVTTRWSGMPGYFVNVANELDETDFSEIDAILIAYGANDYTTPTSILDNPNDLYDTTTVCGALRYSIKQIQTKYPKIQIIVSDPLFRVFYDGETYLYNSEDHNFGSGTLKEYAEAYANACKDMLVPFLNLHDESGININTWDYFYSDECHPDEKGCKRVAGIISGKVETMLSE